MTPADPAVARSTGSETLADRFTRVCLSKDQDLLFTDPVRRISGEQAYDQALAFTMALQDMGIGKGDVVGFLCGSSVRHVVAFYGCQLLGAVPCCLHVRDTAARLSRTMEFIEAKALFVDDDCMDQARDLAVGRALVSLKDDALVAGKSGIGKVPKRLSPDDPAVILQSSGTTGAPKCVIHTQGTLAATAASGPIIYAASSPDDSALVIMAPSFAAWVHTVLPFVDIGGRVHFDDIFEPERFLQTVQDEKITLAPLVPTAWRMVLAAEPDAYDLSHVRCAFYSGEPGSADLVQSLLGSICGHVRTAYLASEGGNAAGVVAGQDILISAPDAVGRSVPGGALRVIDPDGGVEDVLPNGETGEIIVLGGSVSPGYLKQPELTAERFANGWWRSGDLGHLDEDGVLFIEGRLDNQINTGGIKVCAEEIEAALLHHPAIHHAAVVGEPDARWGQRIEAHIVLDGTINVPGDILAFLAQKKLLPGHLRPKAIHVHTALPTGPTGKLYRRALKRG